MKKTVIILLVLSSLAQLKAQEIGFFTSYSGSSYNKYYVNTGIGIEYNQLVGQRNRWGLSAAYSRCKKDYDDIYGSTSDGVSTYIKQVSPNNQHLSFKLNYAYKLLNHPKSGLFLGPEIGIHYFFVDEHVNRLANENIEAAEYQSTYTERNKFGLGFLLEFELNEFISKQLSLYSGIHTEIVKYQRFGMVGGHEPSLIGWLNFHLGLKFTFQKNSNHVTD